MRRRPWRARSASAACGGPGCEPSPPFERADHRRRLERDRRRGARAPDPRAGRTQAGSTSRDRPAGSTRPRTSAASSRWRASRSRESTTGSGACWGWSSCARPSRSRVPSCATSIAARSTSTSRRSTRRRCGSRSPRTGPSSTASRRRGSRASRRARRTRRSRSATTTSTATPRTWPRRSRCSCRSGSRGRTAWP
jgi:hypothetical protein